MAPKCLALTRSKFMGYWISCPFDQNREPTVCPKWDNSRPKTDGDPNNGLRAKRRARLPIETNGVRLENGFGLRVADFGLLLPEVEIGDHVEQNHAEGDEARDDAEPREYEDALVPVGRRRGDSKDEVESPEYFCEKVDHGALRRCEAIGARVQYDIGPTSFSTSTVSTMTMASHGQPSRKHPSGPLLRHFLQPMHRIGSIWMRPNGGLSSAGTQNMQSSTGQYSTQARDPAHPVQHSVITANSFGFFLRAVEIPFERGSNFCSSGTIPGALTTSGAFAICRDSILSVKPLSARFFRQCHACYNARASDSSSPAHHVPQFFLQTPLARAPRRTGLAPLLHLAFPLPFRRYAVLRRACPQLVVPRRLRLLFPCPASSL